MLVEEARRGRGEDRVKIRALEDRTLVLIADGAGGVSRGAETADALCVAFMTCECANARECVDWLQERDREAASSGSLGLAAAVAFTVSEDGTLSDASVGCSFGRRIGRTND